MYGIGKGLLVSGFILFLNIAPAQALEFGIFGDISYNVDSGSDENDAFAVGGVDFFASHAFSDKTRGFMEYVLEGTEGELATDLERLWIAHTFNDALTISAGRFHTPLGHWNRTYHHGALIQDTISRPFFLDFEDGETGVLPVHVVGLMATGDLSAVSGKLGYEFFIANGPSIDTSITGFGATPDNRPEIDINITSGPNDDKSIGMRAIYKADDYPLQVGVFSMHNTVAESSDAGVAGFDDDLVSQTILGFDFRLDMGAFDALVEYYNLDNDDKVGIPGGYTGTAYFAQVGYRINDRFKAVYRHESLNFDDKDAYFLLLGAREAAHNVLALRYDVDESNAIKLEMNRAEIVNGSNSTTYSLQWAFMLP